MKYVIGCTDDERGRAAISLALTLARSLAELDQVELELVHIIHGVSPEDASTQSEKVFQQYQLETAQTWMKRSLDLVPSSINAQTGSVSQTRWLKGCWRVFPVLTPTWSLLAQRVMAHCGVLLSEVLPMPFCIHHRFRWLWHQQDIFRRVTSHVLPAVWDCVPDLMPS